MTALRSVFRVDCPNYNIWSKHYQKGCIVIFLIYCIQKIQNRWILMLIVWPCDSVVLVVYYMNKKLIRMYLAWIDSARKSLENFWHNATNSWSYPDQLMSYHITFGTVASGLFCKISQNQFNEMFPMILFSAFSWTD